MKKFFKIMGFILLTVGTATTAWMTAFYFLNDNIFFGKFFERTSYILMAGVFLVSFAFFSEKTKRLWIKLLLAFVHSMVFVIAMFFENTFYQYINLLTEFSGFDFEITYIESIKISLEYYIKNRSPHYILGLLSMIAFCAMIMVWRIPKFRKFRRTLLNSIFMLEVDTTEEIKEYTSIQEAVSDLDNTHMIGPIQYLIHLEKTEENKQELIRYAEEYQKDTLYDILFDDYKEMLTREEYIRLRTAFRKNADEIISSYDEQINKRLCVLDEYYGIGDIDK